MQTSAFTAVVTREGDHFVALCPEFDMASQGSTVEEALANVRGGGQVVPFDGQR